MPGRGRERRRHAAAAGGQQPRRRESAGQAQEGAAIEGRERLLDVVRLRRAHEARARAPRAATPSAMRSALAMIVTCGFAPVLLGSDEASLT